MSLLIPPHRFGEQTTWDEAKPLLNDNFEKTVQAVADLGIQTTSSTVLSFGSVATGANFQQTVAIVQPGSSSSYPYITLNNKESGLTSIIPSVDVYVDASNDSNYKWPNGVSLSSGQQKLSIHAKVDLTAVDGLASLTVSGRNNDSSAHSYYVTVRVAYFPTIGNVSFR